VFGDPSTAVRTATDPTSGISISSVLAANWFNNGDVCAQDGIGVVYASYFPWPVLGSGWFQQGGVQAQFNAAIPQLEISGLNPDSVYYIKISGSYLYGTDGDPTQYTVAGLNMLASQFLTVGGNTTTGITFQHVAPDANGKIRVYVNTTSTTDIAIISGLQVISGSAQIAMPIVHITSPDNNDILAEETNVVVNATATETGGTITKVEFYADTVKIGEATSAPYSITWNNPNEGHYLITAKATDGAGTTGISTINLSIESLTSFWSMTGNINMNPDSNFVGNVDSVRLAFRTKNIERMSIAPLGNVGIGTINPTAQLHTTGTVRLAGLKNDSTNSQPRMLVADTSGNLYYRNVGSGGVTSVGDGLGQTSNGISIGDSIPGPGQHSFNSNRYQYLNGHFYSIGGSVNDPVNRPVFRAYDNGDVTIGTTMDSAVSNSNGLKYYAATGLLQVGASDRLGFNPNIHTSVLVNGDDSNHIHGHLYNAIVAGDVNTIAANSGMYDGILSGENNYVGDPVGLDQCVVVGYGNNIIGGLADGLVVGSGNTVSKPWSTVLSVTGFQNNTADTARGSVIGGSNNWYGGLWQFVAGNYLVNRTPGGTTLGNGSVDFTTLPYTGLQGVQAPNIANYPIFSIGNSNSNTAAIRSNALTMLFNGRTQINTTGHTTALSQTDVTPKAALDVVSTNTGVLLPRLTTTQRNAIVSGDLQNGLLLYNTDSSAFQYYNGSAWNSFGSGGSGTSGRWQFASATQFDTVNNVAIGTNNTHGYKFAVNGNAIFTKIQVKAITNWADYVFNKDYALPALPQLERYISEHHHLPGIATEAEVLEHGIDIGDHAAALLKKVEELTLYLIAENKRLTEQCSRMDAQDTQLQEQNARLEKQDQQIREQGAKLEAQQKQIDELKALILEINKQK